jgi:apolipoprotein N-acyltransferase
VGWNPAWALALSLLAGLLLVVGHPPVGLGAAGWVAVAPLVALGRGLSGAPLRARVGWGLLAGVVAFGPLLTWLVPFGVAAYGLLVLVQAAAVAVFVLVVGALEGAPWRAPATVAAWVAVEWARSRFPLGGFPWGTLAATQVDVPLGLRVARTLGEGGVVAVLAATGVGFEAAVRGALAARRRGEGAEALFAGIRTPLLAVLGAMTAAVLLGGAAPPASGRTVEVGIAQAGDTRATSAAGVTRLDTDRIVRVAELALEATRPFAADPPDLVVWPENALDADVRSDRGDVVAGVLAQAVALVDPAPLLAGEYAAGPRPRTLRNRSTVYTAGDGGPVPGVVEGASYVKRQPVPFGEYVPARDLLGWIPALRQIPDDTVPGDAAQVIDVAGARVGTVICFENAFAHLVQDQVRAGADVLVVSTNNSSFGDTQMSAQHLAISRLRAVETGRWVVHAGLSGLSAFIDPEGRVHDVTQLFTPASPRREVPLVDATTPATAVGEGVPVAAAALTAAALLAQAFLAYRRL